jgi:ribosomal protein S18 acetylase RimI-like enzyme
MEPELTLRPMTAAEFAALRSPLISGYAAAHVQAGSWSADVAEENAAAELAALLPNGVDTDGMRLLIGEDAAGERVGHLWLKLNRPYGSGSRAYIYDIEIDADHRGKGYGRALLRAGELEAVRHGADAMGLNVFGPNQTARNLYESAGYEITAIDMHKQLDCS